MDNLTRLSKFDVFGVALLILSSVFCVFGLSKFQSNTEDVVQWLPDNSPARDVYDQFEAKFGSDDFLLVTWDGCTIDDPRLLQLCEKILSNDKDHLIQSVVNGADVIDKIRSEMNLAIKHIVNRFRGVFFGVDDPRQTLAIIELTKKGTADRRESLRQIELAIAETPDLELQDVNFGGYPYVGINIDNTLRESFVFFLLPSIFFASIVSLYCLRNILLSSIVFLAAIGAAACSIAIVPMFGFKFGGLMSIIPALVYILTTSGSIHLIHYSLEAIGDPKTLLSISWKPCTISTVTTAIGMLSLMRSSFPAIRSFGLFCAAGAGFALVFQLVVVPWLLHRLGKTGQENLAKRAGHHFWNQITEYIKRYRVVLAFAGIMLMAFSAIGLSRLSARVEVEKLFSAKSDFIIKLANLENQIGPIDQSELVIEFEDVSADDFHVRAQMVYKIQRYVSALKEVGPTHSLLNYLPREPKGIRITSNVKRSIIQARIDSQRDELAKSRFLNISSDSETWRISLRFPFTEETDVSQLQELVLDTAAEAISRLSEKDEFAVAASHPIQLSYTGKNHLFHSAQVTLLQDFYRNFLLAFVIITPVLMVVLRSFWLGLLAMLPNLFPIVVLFGSLGWLNWPIDLAIAMTASVALGIAVDDTTHFLIRFRAFGGSTTNILGPVRKAISQCGPAMLETTAIGSAGLLVYGFSEMTVVSNFSISITCMLVLAIIADILILPALLMLHVKKSKPES